MLLFWLDAQLSPLLASWIQSEFGVTCQALRDVGLRDADDMTIFSRAKDVSANLITKDSDFVQLVHVPAIVWLRCGNTTNAYLKTRFKAAFTQAFNLIRDGEKLVEIIE